MKRFVLAAMCVFWIALTAGCGGGQNTQSSGSASSGSSSSSASTPASGTASMPAVSRYDSGPRAGESPIDESLAEQGEKLFQTKGCTACHAFGKRVTGPDLAGVSMRRTATWLEHQILHPETMVKEDPIARELFAQYALQMPNQKVQPEEAKAIIEYFKEQDHEADEKDEKDEK
jgi:mono/diheme cytochrome c family protein